ncbi:uncharacterized protein AMSG_10569 [Thecamonas trahens ATCC 50062]|uniref:WW domain-containing protein n=1 Tax=Thecamonas trahens ATCC 50062 TaxID=461836 RepID=A0A0L0DRJ6_THETB|nr:hypothetical protein AMSG_10569 [Thecamonas trahens ATCC 50062]KNC54910.1 hypothetical protein AMSG_10569 [Thecamonas trahens ATCC 50062]|eukprot:XP_013753500.1 hypothetical protein AMSG_10569 [Thecamonas trahens ATCC 50062]
MSIPLRSGLPRDAWAPDGTQIPAGLPVTLAPGSAAPVAVSYAGISGIVPAGVPPQMGVSDPAGVSGPVPSQAGGAPPLPPHWERKWDAERGRYYYVNHRDRTTSWTPPDPELEAVIAASLAETTGASGSTGCDSGGSADDDDEELQRVLELSRLEAEAAAAAAGAADGGDSSGDEV